MTMGSVDVTPRKTERASRCLSGDEGAVNRKTRKSGLFSFRR